MHLTDKLMWGGIYLDGRHPSSRVREKRGRVASLYLDLFCVPRIEWQHFVKHLPFVVTFWPFSVSIHTFFVYLLKKIGGPKCYQGTNAWQSATILLAAEQIRVASNRLATCIFSRVRTGAAHLGSTLLKVIKSVTAASYWVLPTLVQAIDHL